jgi:maltose alpha-D-glucosyltransferase/alpha-amylase
VEVWRDAVASAYLGAYLECAGQALFVAKTDAENELLLGFYELEKVIYEVYYELNNRPDWLDIPLTGLVRLIAREA